MLGILGYGRFTEHLLNKLAFLDRQFFLVIDDSVIAERIKALGFETYLSPLGKVTKELVENKDPQIIVIMEETSQAREEIIRNAQETWPDAFIITRDIKESSLEEMGLDDDNVFYPAKLVVNEVLRLMEDNRSRKEAESLEALLKKTRVPKIGIFTHNNPDPDAIASAMGLARIAEHYGVEARIFYGGKVERADNKVFVERLGVKLEWVGPNTVNEVLKEVGLTALVDCGVPGSNNVLPSDMLPNIVIDHHYTEQFEATADFVSYHTDFGACSTILTKYLQDLDIPVDGQLAASLLYGIRTDTHVFTMNTSSTDFKASAYLSALADKEILETFQAPPYKEETMEMIAQAISNRRLNEDLLVSFVDDMTDRDALSQVADILLQVQGVSTVLIFGEKTGKYYISARNKAKGVNIGEVLKGAFDGLGSAGGHPASAGAQIPKDKFEGPEELAEFLLNVL